MFRHNRLIQGFNILTIFGGRGRIFVMGVLKFIRVKEQNCHKRIAKTYTNMTKDSTRYIKWTFLDSPHPYPKKKCGEAVNPLFKMPQNFEKRT